MKATLYTITGAKKKEITLPSQFSEPLRKDLIKRAVLAIESHNYQPHGTSPRAGTKQGDATPKRRHRYGSTYGPGISRVKRKVMWSRGTQFGWVGAFVANVIGGRKAFPPLSNTVIAERINTKERRKAIRSAIAATKTMIIEDKFENLKKTKEVKTTLENIGLKEELERASIKKVRPGKGTMRGRKYKTKKGPLLVTSKIGALYKSANNIPGIDTVEVKSLNAELLAPGTHPGRTTIWTESAIKELEGGLFY